MMKQNRFQYLAMAAMSVCLLASCSSDSELSSALDTSAEQVVRVTTNVDDVHSRAIYTTNNLDAFGMSIINPSNSKYTYNNVKWTKGGDGKWTPASQMLWQSYTQSVDIVAYAPYQENVNQPIPSQVSFPFSVSKDQSVASDRSDFIIYKKAGFIPRDDLDDNKSIKVGFSHLLSQLRINITFTADEFADILTSGNNPITEIKVNGTKLGANVNFTTTPVQVSVDESADAISVIPENTSFVAESRGSASYSAILVSQTIAASNFSVDLLIAGKQYSWKPSSDITLDSGKGYDLSLKVGKGKIYASPFSVSDWGTGESITGGEVDRSEADKMKVYLTNEDFSHSGDKDLTLTLSKNADVEVFKAIASAISAGNASVNLTLKGVVAVPEEALNNVKNLKSINFPDVKELKDNAIVDCADLETVKLQKLNVIGQYVFKNCAKIKTMNLGPISSVHDTFLTGAETDRISLTVSVNQKELIQNGQYWILAVTGNSYWETDQRKSCFFLLKKFSSLAQE